MGVNLGQLAHTLGLGGQSQTQLPQPNPNPGFSMSGQAQPQPVGMRNLLGNGQGELPALSAPGAGQNDSPMDGPVAQAQAPAQAPPADIEVQGNAPRMSAESLGMPGMPAARAANAEATGDLRQALQDKANMARDIYHHKSEFGTHGILRDVIGNVEDFGRKLLGFSPRYNDEKWAERAYGMSSSDPAVAAAATEQAMQYNPTKTQEYLSNLVKNDATKTSTAATAEYKNSQVAARSANLLSGFGAQLYQANADADPATAQANYTRILPALQATLDKVYGPGNFQAPEQYSPEFARQLAQAGFTGTNVQRAQANTLDNDTRMKVAQMSDSTKRALGAASNDTRIRVAQIMASTALSRAQMEAQIRRELGLSTETEVKTESGSIIHPTITTTRQKTNTYTDGSGGGGAAPAAPQRKFSNGHWYKRGPNGEAILDD